MPNMSSHLKQLEELENLEAEVIKNTKVHKVLKAIIKLNSIPKEEDFNFKHRSNNLLTKWSGALAADTEATTGDASAVAPTTNGVKHDEEKKSEPPAAEKSEEKEAPAAPEAAKQADGDGDVSMAEAKEDAPAVKADAPASPGAVAKPTETVAT